MSSGDRLFPPPGGRPVGSRSGGASGGASGPWDDGTVEALAGAALVALVLLVALIVRHHPGPNIVDHWGFSLIHPATKDVLYRRITELHSVPFLVAGSILAAVVAVGRDRVRALVCLVAPVLSVVLVEWLLKPVVARRYAEVLSFPSGTTTVVASVAAAWAVAVPRGLRPVAVAAGALVVGLECIAVVALQWHFPSDALGGVAFGVGVVLLVDGLAHLASQSIRRRRASPSGTGAPGRPAA